MSEGGKRNYGRIEAPPRRESGRHQLLPDPTVTAPVLDSTVDRQARGPWAERTRDPADRPQREGMRSDWMLPSVILASTEATA